MRKFGELESKLETALRECRSAGITIDNLEASARRWLWEMARNAMIDFVDGEVGPNKNVPGLIRGAEICVSIAAQLRKGGNQ